MKTRILTAALVATLALAGCASSDSSAPATLDKSSVNTTLDTETSEPSNTSSLSSLSSSATITDNETSQSPKAQSSTEASAASDNDKSAILDKLILAQDQADALLKESCEAVPNKLLKPYFNGSLDAMRFITLFGIGAKLDQNSARPGTGPHQWVFDVTGDGEVLATITARHEFDRIFIDNVNELPASRAFRDERMEMTKTWAS